MKHNLLRLCDLLSESYEAGTLQICCHIHVQHVLDTDTPRTHLDMRWRVHFFIIVISLDTLGTFHGHSCPPFGHACLLPYPWPYVFLGENLTKSEKKLSNSFKFTLGYAYCAKQGLVFFFGCNIFIVFFSPKHFIRWPKLEPHLSYYAFLCVNIFILFNL